MRAFIRNLSILALAALLTSSCGTDGGERAGAAGGPPALSGTGERLAAVCGTVVDAETGAAVAGATIEGPGGARATSDAHGRFNLTGLPVGAEGDLVARTKDGRTASNPLRELRAGTLEVVLRLRRP